MKTERSVLQDISNTGSENKTIGTYFLNHVHNIKREPFKTNFSKYYKHYQIKRTQSPPFIQEIINGSATTMTVIFVTFHNHAPLPVGLSHKIPIITLKFRLCCYKLGVNTLSRHGLCTIILSSCSCMKCDCKYIECFKNASYFPKKCYM